MKEQSRAYLAKAGELLDQADTMLSVNLSEAAGRTAYLAGFHAAQAFLFETTGRIYKTHSGVRGEFGRLIKDDARADDQSRAFLGNAYNLKAIADYEIGPGSHIPPERARLTIDAGRRFVACVTGLMPEQEHEASADPKTAKKAGLVQMRTETEEGIQEQEPKRDHER